MLIGRALAVGAIASRALVVGTPLPAEVGACGQIVVRTVEALASKRGGRRLRVAEVGVTIAISRIREPHHRDREQPRHDDLSHRFFPLCTKPPSRAQESFESINPLPYPQTKPRHRRASKVEGAEISAFVVTQITYFRARLFIAGSRVLWRECRRGRRLRRGSCLRARLSAVLPGRPGL